MFTYRTTFDLLASQVDSARIDGLNGNDLRWTSDNNGLQILLNGNLLFDGNTGDQSYHAWNSISPISSLFLSGQNVLEFVIKNNAQQSGNPTGFRFEGGVFTAPVPEPSSLALIATGRRPRRPRRLETPTQASPGIS